MKIKLDENLPNELAEFLALHRHDLRLRFRRISRLVVPRLGRPARPGQF
ncbi:MAG TPA: hypothetical protein VN541_24950 [Tepidisphaeraceae bacterium]|nr:hypothetical protein [Tepidisphaeraceae bacterium]